MLSAEALKSLERSIGYREIKSRNEHAILENTLKYTKNIYYLKNIRPINLETENWGSQTI